LLLVSFIFGTLLVSGQVPPGYYDGTEGLAGEELRSALFNIIKGHDEQSYNSLWTHFQSTDKKPDGTVWDMYSDIPGGNPVYIYAFVVDQCGNYGAEGDCYNREHSFPKSWFNDAAPMVTDLFHIYPTDGFVNGQRGNYPYGEVGNPSWVSTNGSKLGNCSFPGYSDIVFEPIDEYKGDFARTYFYMMTRYLDLVSTWTSPMLSGNDLSAWAESMLIQWNDDDPVSEKETDRNNAVYEIQANRNPFIDHPEWVSEIWGFPSGLNEEDLSKVKIWY
jgi:endonuclease I